MKSNGRLCKTRDRIDRTGTVAGARRLRALGCAATWVRPPAISLMATRVAATALAGPDMLQTVDDNELVRSKALRHDPQAVDFGPEFYQSILDAVILGQCQHEFFGKIRSYGTILDENDCHDLPRR